AAPRLEPVRRPASHLADARRRSLAVDDARIGDRPARPARAPCAPAEVDLFEVEKVALVEAADPLEHLTADDERGARDPVAALRPAFGDRVDTDQASRKAELRSGDELGERRGKRVRALLTSAMLVLDRRADDAGGGVRVEVAEERAERAGA